MANLSFVIMYCIYRGTNSLEPGGVTISVQSAEAVITVGPLCPNKESNTIRMHDHYSALLQILHRGSRVSC